VYIFSRVNAYAYNICYICCVVDCFYFLRNQTGSSLAEKKFSVEAMLPKSDKSTINDASRIEKIKLHYSYKDTYCYNTTYYFFLKQQDISFNQCCHQYYLKRDPL